MAALPGKGEGGHGFAGKVILPCSRNRREGAQDRREEAEEAGKSRETRPPAGAGGDG